MASLVLLAGGGFGNTIKSLFGSLLSPTKPSQAELVSSPPLSALPTPTPIASPPYAKAPMHGSPDTVMTDLSISNSPEILRKNSGCIAEAGVISGRFANINSSFGPQPASHPNPRIRRCQSAIVSQDPNFFPDSDVAAGASTSVPSNLMLFRHRTFPPADDLEPGQTVNNFSAPRASPARVGKVRSFNVGYNMSLSDTY